MAGPWNGLPSLREPRAYINPIDPVNVGGAYTAAVDMVGIGAKAVRQVLQPILNDQAQAAGADSVTRDADGKLTVQTRFEFEEQDQVYNNAARSSYLSQMQVDLRQQFMDLRKDPALALDPEAFRIAADGAMQGTLDTAPASMRGAVQSLYGEEMLRNQQDISDKQERVRLQRQESSIKANIEMSQSDVFALAMQPGGLATPDGVQAVNRYIASVRAYENPIWGVAPEAIQLQIDETLSLAKAYAVKGQIVGLYQSQGVEAAAAATKSFLGSTDLQLSPAQRNALENDIMGEIRGLETARRTEAAAARTAMTAARTENAANIGMMIDAYRYGAGGDPKELLNSVDMAAGQGALSPTAHRSLRGQILAEVERKGVETAKVQAKVGFAAGRIDTGLGFDPTDEKEREALRAWVDITYGDKPPAEVIAAAVPFARSQGIVMPQAVDYLKPGLYSGSPEARTKAAVSVMELVNANPRATDKAFNATELEDSRVLVDAISNGQSPEDAVKALDEMHRLPEDVRDQRRKQLEGAWLEGGAKTPAGGGRLAAMDAVGALGVPVATYDKRSTAPEDIAIGSALSDYQAAYNDSFIRTGNAQAAKEAGDRAVRSTYGATRFGMRAAAPGVAYSSFGVPGVAADPAAQPRLQHLAPETVYGMGMKPDAAHAWIAEDLGFDLAASGRIPAEFGLDSWDEVSRLQLEPVPNPAPNGGVVYNVIGPNGKVLTDDAGVAMVWQPDVERYKAKLSADEAAKFEAARKRGAVEKESPTGPLEPRSLMRLFGLGQNEDE